MPIEPQPCGAGGSGDAGPDVEQTLLCDVLPDGTIVGSALAVYEYDETGAPIGAPTFVDPATGLPYVAQGVLQPCGNVTRTVEILCDVNDADGSAVQFERVKTIGPAGTVLSIADFGLDGAPYTPLNDVQVCDPYSNCTPDANQDLNAQCGPGETVTRQVLLDDLFKPLANSVFNDDATADPLCGGTWDRPADALPAGFPVAETFRNTTFDQPGPVIQGQPNPPFLTAGPPVNDGAGAGWIRLSDGSVGSNGIWQVPGPFSTSQGMNASVTLASHDGTTPGGDGQYFVFTDGAAGTQATPIGGFGNLGLNNWTGGVFAVVLDEYGQSCTCGQALPSDPNPGPCGFCGNTISIQRAGASRVGATCTCCTIASTPLAPKAINQTTRAKPLRLLTSVISEGGQTYVSASVDWNDGNGPIQYFDRVNITACITVPPTLRMGLSMNSGGAFQAVKEARDAVARPAGVSNWRAFPITTDAIPACVSLVNINASVDVTPNDDGSQTAGNGEPEAYFWLVNTATNTVLGRDQYSIIPSQLGQVKTLTVSASVPPADVPNLRLYVGAESRDDNGEYDTTWENLTVDATGTGCPATPRRTMEISARCPIPVTIVGGGTGEGGGGGTTIVNTPSTFEDQIVCGTVGGVPQTAFRREVRSPDGGVEVTFLGFNGLPITPDGGWTPGPCPTDCESLVLGDVCVTSTDFPGAVLPAVAVQSCEDGTVAYINAATGDPWPNTTGVVICPPDNQAWEEVLCDQGNGGHQFRRVYNLTPLGAVITYDEEFDTTPYAAAGPVTMCGTSATTVVQEMCDRINISTTVQFYRQVTYDSAGNIIALALLDADNIPYVPVGEIRLGHCDPNQPEHEILCDMPSGVQFLRVWRYSGFDADATGFHDYTLDGIADYLVAGTAQACTDAQTPESLALCDITQEPSLDGARSALNLTTLPNGPTAGAFPNGINFTVDQGVPGGSGTYLITTSTTQNWTFSEPSMLRFGVNNLNIGAECVTLPAGTVVESIHANHTYNPLTRVLCNGGAAAGVDESIFTLDAATTLAITSNPGGGGQRGLVRLEAAPTVFTEVRTPFLRTICRTCGAAPVVTDTAMDAVTPYVPVGTVSVCDVPAAADEDCRNSTTLLICDLPTGDPDGTPTVTDTAQQFIPDTANADFIQRPGGGGALWTGGVINFGPDAGGGPGITQVHRYAAATLQAVPPSCTDGTVHVSLSVQVLNQGPGAGCSGAGRFRLYRVSDGAVLASGSPLFNTPAGATEHLTIEADVAAAELTAGNVAVWLDVETWQTGTCAPPDNKVWQASNFTAAYAYGTDGCETQFLRTLVTDCQTGEILATVDTTVDGAPYVVAGQVGECTGASSSGDPCPCVSAESIGTAVADALGATPGRDEEVLVLCDATPTRFLRRYNYDSTTGALVSIVNTTLDGSTAFAPVGAVGVCTTAIASDFDFLSTVLCDANGTQFIQRLTFNSATGAVTATTNTTLTGGAFAPVAPIGLCSSCCPVVMGEGCTNVGSLRYTALRLTTGAISLIDSVTGAAVLAANIVACAPANGVLPSVAADHFEAVPGTPWTTAAIPAGRRLVSLTYTVLTGTATVVDATGGTSIATIPAGYSASWTAQDDRETLTPPASITSVGGRVIVLMLTAA